ncbi:L-ascorbate metabolism protein UlaG (beta-lactamase superfamily) [Mesocricetibacter intestinalis]|uniref:L-ascorbate metabolism protein UlaG (Beta-lactamase superfamily) n=1 Tax=Mesocricetibacter intestinalis TaxID=1521930 RepID=A0A4R6V6L2_9PAST|nr:MBL fold metallo-hydrolase [Mesocricetibacter intestinalis]TDQ56491.1 L-ascorbate metabolism protein UlaG (beta-lactamase superfamily) [Mesocricetibacter intestinalis]
MLKNIFIALILLIAFVLIGAYWFMHSKPFGRYPEGERLQRVESSPNYHQGEFRNLSPKAQSTQTTKKPRWQVFYEFLFEQRENLRPQQKLPGIKTDLKALPADRNFFVWFGHSSYLLQLEGKRFLVDPVLVAGSPLSFINKMFEGSNLYGPQDMPSIDYLIITHDHWDHLDYEAVTALQPKVGRVITGLGVGAHLEYWGYPADKIIELDWDQQVRLEGEFRVTALPAQHFSGRDLTRNKTLWASFMLQTPHENIYIGGDSGYGDFYRDIGRRFPHISLAIMENGQYNQDWSNIHILPEQLLQAIRDLNPQRVIGVHNSKFALSKHPWKEPLEKLFRGAQQQGFNLFTPMIGEVFYFSEDNQEFTKWWETIR